MMFKLCVLFSMDLHFIISDYFELDPRLSYAGENLEAFCGRIINGPIFLNVNL